jgi:ribonuclease Z
MVPELDVMFDAGPLPAGALKYQRILISHGHQDHAGLLPYLVSQRGLMNNGVAQVHVPREMHDPLRRIFEAWSEIEGFDLPVELHPHDPEDQVTLGRGCTARCLRTVHRVPSLAWLVSRTTQRLRPEFQGRQGEQLRDLKKQGTEITQDHTEALLCVTGDTQIDLFVSDERLRQCKVLVHEVTSWDDRRDTEATRKWGHTHVDELIEHCEKFEGEALVLVHRSLRHKKSEAERIVQERFPASVRHKIHVFGG